MTDWGLNLDSAMRFEKGGNFCLYKIRTIIIKNTKKKSKNKNKEVQPKIMNCFLICVLISFCPDKTREIDQYH